MKLCAMVMTAVWVLGFAGGCRKKERPAPVLVLGPLEVADVSPRPEGRSALGEGDLAAITARLTEQIEAAGLAARPKTDAGLPEGAAEPATLRVRIAVGCEHITGDRGALDRAAVEMRLDERPGAEAGALHAELLATGVREQAKAAPAGSRCGELARRTAEDRLGRFLAGWRLRAAPPAVVAEALAADGGARLEAIRLVGERHLDELSSKVLTFLHDEDEEVRDAALGTVLLLKDRRAVAALTRGRDLQDRHELRKVVDAVAVLGGQEAEEFLSFVAATHEDPEIRGMATRALDRMRRDAGGS